MAAVANTSQKQPASSSGEPTPERVERIDFARQQEIQCLKDHCETQIRMLQDMHMKEKRALKQENQKMENDNRVQKIGSSSQPQQDRQCGIGTADDGKVSLHNFQFIRRLGEHRFGTVVLAKGKLLGGLEQLYAIKALKKRTITPSNICDIMAEKEALMLTSGHPFIMTLYSCFQNKDHIFFVMEFMSGGDLKDQLNKVEFFSEKRATFYAVEITLAVQFLHQHGILHPDLKLENVLVGSETLQDCQFWIVQVRAVSSLQSQYTMWNAVLYGSRDSVELALWPRR